MTAQLAPTDLAMWFLLDTACQSTHELPGDNGCSGPVTARFTSVCGGFDKLVCASTADAIDVLTVRRNGVCGHCRARVEHDWTVTPA